MQYWILIFALFLSAASAAESVFTLRLETNSVSFRAKSGEKVTLHVGKLFYKEHNGTVVPAYESYVVETIGDGYPRIIDRLDGHSVTFQFADLDGDAREELLAFYFAGGNQYAVKLYKVDGIEILPLKTQPHSSNMRSIRITGNVIVVKNQGGNTQGVRFISTDTYKVIGGDCKRVRERKARAEGD